ncbi:MAG TPA: ATP-binding cassette domain-containing protein [Myxococcaceae bacterium]|nr:ATP-binding cassette domain-containing protein [Myxococcaceae bacterium]
MATVETRALRKEFTGHTAVDGVDLAIREGEFLVLLGPSGCGKTTLLRMIAGLEKQTSGDILIGGRVVNELPPRTRKIAMVFQSYALYPHLSVASNIAFPLKAQGAPRESIAGEVERAAKMFGIERLLQRKPRQLSGGERQRVALARAMVRHPDVFLLDEPLSNLDAKLRNLARDELKQFQRRLGTTTIYVTHDQVEAMGLGDRIAVMSGGKVRQLGRPQEVYDEPADTFVAGFLGSPPTNLVTIDGVLVGFRPEQLLPPGAAATEGAGPIVPMRFSVDRVENLGAGRLLYGTLPDHAPNEKIIVSLAYTVHSSIEAGRTYEFRVHQSNLKFFDPATGLRVPARPLRRTG